MSARSGLRFFCRHAEGAVCQRATRCSQPDLRHAMVFDDVENLEVEGLDALVSPGASAMLRYGPGEKGADPPMCAAIAG